jgi:hypothetical protein
MASGAIWLFGNSPVRGQSLADTGDGKQPAALLGQLNEKAKAVKGGGEASIRKLADEVFKSVALEQAPAGMLDAVKDRLVRAEVSYQNGRAQGITEISVVRAVNGLAIKFKAPEYAKTSRYEVRKLRMGVLAIAPNFIAGGRSSDSQQPKRIGSSIAPDMSPMEAAFVTVLLLRQKVSNPDYQLTHAERVGGWAEKHGGKQKDKAKPAKAQQSSARREEMENIIARGGSEISPIDLLNIPDRALDILGVQK